MEAQLKVEVVSNEFVKPSCMTPPNRETMTLSFLDESFPAIHIPSLLIYTESTKTVDDNVMILKTSLSETLTHFYPLAGRFENEYTVSCNDEGIPFIVTRVNCQLNDFLNSPRKLDTLPKFLPPDEIVSLGQHPIAEVIPLAIQVNFFACGGVAVGSFGVHKLFDAISASNFFNYWAALASERYGDLVEPDFDSIVRAFPPLPEEKRVKVTLVDSSDGDNDQDGATLPSQAGLSQHLNLPIKVVAKIFKFNKDVIKKLKIHAACETIPYPSTFEALVGFVWMHAMDALLSDNNDATRPVPNALSFGASLRSRTSPPLSRHSMGNITTNLHARVDYEKGSCSDDKLKEIVREIHGAVQTVKQKLEALQIDNAAEIFLAERNTDFKDSVKDNVSTFIVFNWCKLGLNGVDFGFGPPAKIIPLSIVYPFLRNTMMLVEYSDDIHGDGIEVYVFLEDKHMPVLEANPHFMSFAKIG